MLLLFPVSVADLTVLVKVVRIIIDRVTSLPLHHNVLKQKIFHLRPVIILSTFSSVMREKSIHLRLTKDSFPNHLVNLSVSIISTPLLSFFYGILFIGTITKKSITTNSWLLCSLRA